MYQIAATMADLIEVANNLSEGDLSDFNSMQKGREPLDVFPRALDQTTQAIKLNGKVLAVGGHGGGGLWFVTTNVVLELSRAQRYRFYRILKAHLALVRREVSTSEVLTNYVAVGNVLHVRLLEKLGATFQSSHVLSPAGFPFKQFWL